mgnify:CR=1 FL=1
MTPELGARVTSTPDGTAYATLGTGEPLVLVHGVGMQQGAWAPQITALSRTHRVVVYDMLGHGASRLPQPDATLADYAQQLAALLEGLDWKRVHAVGQVSIPTLAG